MAKSTRRDIAKVLAERSLGRVNSKTFSEQIAAYLLAERRTADLEPLLRDIMEYRAEHGIVEVVAVSAHPINEAVRADITKQVQARYKSAKQIIISEELDPDMVGGVRLEFPAEQLDLTVRAKLSRFKQLTSVGL